MDIERLAGEAGLNLKPADAIICRASAREHLARFTALVLEEAAKVCDKRVGGPSKDEFHSGFGCGADQCARAIRALIPSTPVPATDRQ
jgi:hypothetical protein